MTQLVWDAVGSRRFESGVSRGVLYPPVGDPVPWNGLTAVEEAMSPAPTPLFLEGRKVFDRQLINDFQAKVKALTYPDELDELTGTNTYGSGLQVYGQRNKRFGFSYRSGVGDDLQATAGYKIHLVYNVVATPTTRSFSTMNATLSATEFEWQLDTKPIHLPGFRPTAHYVVDSTKVEDVVMEEFEGILYGTPSTDPTMPTIEQLLNIFAAGPRPDAEIDEDGGWTMTGDDRFFAFSDDGTAFEVYGVDADIVGDTYTMESN